MGHLLDLITVEVERKFRPTPDSIRLLRTNSGTPPFRNLEYLGQRKFEDIYFDKDGILLSKGIWVRRRDDEWEAKVRQGGDYTNSQFMEMAGYDKVANLVAVNVPRAQIDVQDLGMKQFARFATARETWLADGKFLVVLDTADFGHLVGEVELVKDKWFRKDANELVLRRLRRIMATRMDSQISEFMRMHPWAFPPGEVKGKLSAYFESEQGC